MEALSTKVEQDIFREASEELKNSTRREREVRSGRPNERESAPRLPLESAIQLTGQQGMWKGQFVGLDCVVSSSEQDESVAVSNEPAIFSFQPWKDTAVNLREILVPSGRCMQKHKGKFTKQSSSSHVIYTY